MKVAVLLKQVPDVADELQIAADGKDVDRDALTYKLNEFDDYALEEALQLKDSAKAEVIALAIDAYDADQILYAALAKGADRAIKIGGSDDVRTNRAAAAMFAAALAPIGPDLVLTGVQAADDLDGQLGPLLAVAMQLPHASVVTGIEVDGAGKTVKMSQEFSGGVVASLEADLPLVIGVQASRVAPRYAPITRIRQAMSSGKLESVAVAEPDGLPVAEVRAFRLPEAGAGAELIDGSPADAARRLVAILRERGFGRA